MVFTEKTFILRAEFHFFIKPKGEWVKSVIVTGSTSGIGLGVAKVFAKNGYRVVLNGVEEPASVLPLIEEIKEMSSQDALYAPCDLSTPDGCYEIVKMCVKAFGTVDVVVNNAGIQHKALAQNFDDDKWRKVIALNLEAAFYISKAALPYMYEKQWGRLIHVSSVHGLVASTEKAAYVAAKHGLLGLSKVFALEAAGTGVTSNCICPGWVLTPLVEKQIQGIADKEGISFESAKDKLLREKQPSGEFATPEQMGESAFYLASDAASQMTGAHLTIDGGWSAQ